MKSYFVFCCPGTGGLFLTSVIAQLLGFDCQSIFSNTGHAHDMGNGNWKGHSSVCLVGDHWDLNYRSGFPLYYSHVLPENFLHDNAHIETIYIDAYPSDFKKVSELYVKKAWPDLWSKEQYDKWLGPDYPPYSPDNIATSTIIQNDLISDFAESVVHKWYQHNQSRDTYKKINFRTIMGIDDQNLMQALCDIMQQPINNQVQQTISRYQAINQNLYFQNYQ